MNNIESRSQNTPEESEKSELEYVREQAQAKIDAYLVNPELSDPQRVELLDGKIAIQQSLLVKYDQEEQDDIQGYREHYLQLSNIPGNNEYNEELLEKQIAEIKDRYGQWRLEVAEIVSLLDQAKERFTSQVPPTEEEPTGPVGEPPATQEAEQTEVKPKEEDKTEKLEKIKEIRIRTQELVEDSKHTLSSARRIIEDTRPANVTSRSLQSFSDEHLARLNNDLNKISDIGDRISADRDLEDNMDELNNNFQRFRQELEESYQRIRSYQRRMEDTLNQEFDRDDAIIQVGSVLRRTYEDFDSKYRSISRIEV